jgi:hypothetical protein
LAVVVLRGGLRVEAQWWSADPDPDRAWFRPVTPVEWSPCRPGGCVLVDAGSLREACCPEHAAELPPVLGHGTGDLLGLLDGGS